MGKRAQDRSRGQALVEVALVAPLFFLMVFGTIDIGRVIWANDSVGSAAREGARYASVHAGYIDEENRATEDMIREHTLNFVFAAGVNPSVTVCFASAATMANQGAGCNGDVSETGVGFERGNLVKVGVTSQVPVILGSFFGAGNWTVTGESIVLINN